MHIPVLITPKTQMYPHIIPDTNNSTYWEPVPVTLDMDPINKNTYRDTGTDKSYVANNRDTL